MYPWFTPPPPPPYYPQYPPQQQSYPPIINSSEEALKLAKAWRKEARRIKREIEGQQKKPEPMRKSGWEKLDTLHVFLGMLTMSPFVGIVMAKLLESLVK